MESSRKESLHCETYMNNSENTSSPIAIPSVVQEVNTDVESIEEATHDTILRSTDSQSPSFAARVGMMLRSPSNYKRAPPLREVSSLTPQYYGSGGESEEDDDNNEQDTNLQYLNLKEVTSDLDSRLKGEILQFDEVQPTARSYNIHKNYDERELKVEGSVLVPVKNARLNDDSVSPPRNRRPMPKKMLEQAFCLDEQSFENVKHHTRRLFNKHQQKARRGKNGLSGKGKKSAKNRKNSANDLTPSSSNTDDFTLRQGSAKKINAVQHGIAQEVEVVSDVSDTDPDQEEICHQEDICHHNGRRIRIKGLAQHINNIPKVVKCVNRFASNMYLEVNQIMEDNAKITKSRASFSPSSSNSTSSLMASDHLVKPHQANPYFGGMERHSSNLLAIEIEQTYSDFNKEMDGVLKQHETMHERIPSLDSFAEEDMPPVSVRDRVKAFEVQNALESSLAAGQQGPSTPRIKGRKISAEEKKGPPNCLFKQIQPPKLNDTLKIVFVSAPHTEYSKTSIVHSLATRKSKKRKLSEKRSMDMNTYLWEPEGNLNGDLLMLGYGPRKPRFRLFDLKGGNLESGSHHSMQSLFFSPDSLYVIAWDLAVNNKLLSEHHITNESDDDSSDGDSDDEFEKAERLETKRNAINHDIDENVLYWFDVIAELNFPGCVIMPVAVYSGSLDLDEIKQRCGMLKERLKIHQKRYQSSSSLPRVTYGSKDMVPVISINEDDSIDDLRRAILEVSSIDNNCKASAFKDHFKPISPMILSAQDAISVFRSKGHKVVRFDDIFLEISKRPPIVDDFSKNLVREAIGFLSSTGDILYFGDQISQCSNRHYLKKFIVLKPQWLSVAIDAAITSKNIQSFRDQDLSSNPTRLVKKCFENLYIEKNEAIQIWEQSMYICEENKLNGDTSSKDLSLFLQQICEHAGIFVSMGNGETSSLYLLPRVLAEPSDYGCPWTFKSARNYKTVLCHSWLIREILPVTFMDEVIATIVTQLNDLSEQNETDSHTIGSSMDLFVEQIFCYKTSVYTRIVERVLADDRKEYYDNITEIYVRLTRVGSPNCVGVDGMRDTDQKLIICGKGFVGNNGEKIWKFGYDIIRKSLERVVSKWTKRKSKILREIACPDCLLTKNPADASLWPEDHILKHGDEMVLCSNPANVHRVNPKLLRGDFLCDDDDCSVATTHTAYSAISHFTAYSAISNYTAMSHTGDLTPSRSIEDLLPSIVLVGVWDKKEGTIKFIGSGFIADKNRGLVITAGHIFYELNSGVEVGKIFHNLPDATAVVAVLDKAKRNAIFTYTADIVTHDLGKVDACVLRLKSKFERPVAVPDTKLPYPQPLVFGPLKPKFEDLQQLVLQDKFELESSVRIIGYNQEGEGIVRQGAQIDHNPCFAGGRVVKFCDNSHHDDLPMFDPQTSDRKLFFCPQSEIVVQCKSKHGHSGGPAINDIGEVIGIVSRSDALEDDRCYLAPARLLHQLLKKAKAKRSKGKPEARVRFNSTLDSCAMQK